MTQWGEGGLNLYHLGAALPHGVSRTEFFPARVRLIIFKRIQTIKPATGGRSKLQGFRSRDRRPRNTKIFAKLRKLFLLGSIQKIFRREIPVGGGR